MRQRYTKPLLTEGSTFAHRLSPKEPSRFSAREFAARTRRIAGTFRVIAAMSDCTRNMFRVNIQGSFKVLSFRVSYEEIHSAFRKITGSFIFDITIA